MKILKEEDELYDLEEEEEWFENPGGIPGVVLSRLPNFLLIPAQDKVEELSGTSGALMKTLSKLFEDVRNASPHYLEAQKYLNLLQEELDPSDDTKEFGKMMKGLNKIVEDVFPNTRLLATANLSDANKSIKPIFEIKMSNNVNTPIENQGTGVIRSAVFAMLRYRTMRETAGNIAPLIIGFEEPEIYLHPNAAHQLRDTIYELANTSSNQIICTTHSPFMIDLSRKSNQVLNHFIGEEIVQQYGSTEYRIEKITSNPFNITDAFKALQGEDRTYVKMLLKMDDYMAKIFFAERVLIVEGDTEDIVIREAISRMPQEVRKDILHNWHVVKARGKASIISLAKYLRSMGIHPYVIHDKDEGTAGAEVFNEPIKEVVGEERRVMLENCIEDVLGYPAPSSDKPYRAHKYLNSNWGNSWDEVTGDWKTIMEELFFTSFNLISEEVAEEGVEKQKTHRKGIAIAKKEFLAVKPVEHNH
ncbi:AAA family ATPase [Cytobacillus pseudoceanisediminis]|uniref:ATP-dependent nuclease n=1 Tax=Cytobacillus pseudoceanisediminis TaxID=3051614 RepID=UPI00218A77DF|nr:AAA family ATPase [Cytobacillus pseudoceanisediminis]UQX55106.1 AAA family ATPase [Cytobacillus pseudoceanisediminis]